MLDVRDLTKRYDDHDVVKNVTFRVEKGEIFGIIGPSGAGKSTVLRLLDLLEDPTSGSITLFGQDLTSSPDKLALRRQMAMLFQKPVVLTATVTRNVELGLEYRHMDRKESRGAVMKALTQVGLQDLAGRRAKTLSGGEMQRVAFARAIVTEPKILFLDEPTANLDPKSTRKIEELILSLKKEARTTMVISTHDMLQGQRLSDRIGVMMEGEMLQVGTPREIFHTPNSTKIARFVGVENIIEGTITANNGGEAVVGAGGLVIHAVSSLPPGQKVRVFFRAEDVTLDLTRRESSSARNLFRGRVEAILHYGPYVHVTCACGLDIRAMVTLTSVDELGLSQGKEVWVSFKATAVHVVAEGD
jgi:tungstate transport system ATP-binding protein